MSEIPAPQWAMKRARELAQCSVDCPTMYAFARYIAAHEEPPVDPLAEEAQQIADFNRINLSAQPRVEHALMAALRRGMELARKSENADV